MVVRMLAEQEVTPEAQNVEGFLAKWGTAAEHWGPIHWWCTGHYHLCKLSSVYSPLPIKGYHGKLSRRKTEQGTKELCHVRQQVTSWEVKQLLS